MNYLISVNRTTKKGHTETLHQFAVNSNNTQQEIISHMQQQYQGFSVSVQSIQTLDLNFEKQAKTRNPSERSTLTSLDYRDYYVDKELQANDFSESIRKEWELLDKTYAHLYEKSFNEFVENQKNNPGFKELKKHSYCFPNRTFVRIVLPSDLFIS